jgi:mannosyl-glycoprotein endo-beta-N-acetylglucosaminidase
MPLRGTGHSKLVGDDAPYFESLAELDAWAATPSKKLSGVLRFQASRQIDGLDSEHQGKLLVNELISTLITQLS